MTAELDFVPRAPGSFGDRKGQPWTRHGATARRRQEQSKDSTGAGTNDPIALLTPQKIRDIVGTGVCPWCGEGPFKVIAAHINKAHGIERYELRKLALLPKSAKLTGESFSRKLTEIHGERLREMNRSANTPERAKAIASLGREARSQILKIERDALREGVMSRYEAGGRQVDISVELGISLSRVRRILREGGFTGDMRVQAAERRKDQWVAVSQRMQAGRMAKDEMLRDAYVEHFESLGDPAEAVEAMAVEYGTSTKSVRARLRRYGVTLPDMRGRSPKAQEANQKRRGRPECSVEKCGRPNAAKGLCDTHYRKARKAKS